MTIKKSLLGAALSFALFSSGIHASDNVVWQGANVLGGTGSALSFAFWAEKIGNVAVIPGRGVVLTGLAAIPRVILDAACVGTSIRGDKNLTTLSAAINLGCFIGSAYSLVLWAPAIIANFNNPLYAARGAIDILQMVLTGTRLYKCHKKV